MEHLCDWFGDHFWFYLVGPQKWGQKLAKLTVIDGFGLIAAEVVSWLPGQAAVEIVG